MRERFLTIGQAKVATSGARGLRARLPAPRQDEVIVSRAHQLAYAKECALDLWNKGYTKPPMRKDIKVLGQEGLGIVYVGANSMQSGNYISEHDTLISQKLGYVLCGGDLSESHRSERAIPAGPGAEGFPGTVYAAEDVGALAVDHHSLGRKTRAIKVSAELTSATMMEYSSSRTPKCSWNP
jgi:hypothetical protein